MDDLGFKLQASHITDEALNENPHLTVAPNALYRRVGGLTPSPSASDVEALVGHVTPCRSIRSGSSITSAQKTKLSKIDQHRCLITRSRNFPPAIQACHIIRRSLDAQETIRLGRLWGITLNVDSTANLVHLRSDWHIAYDCDYWTFLPVDDLLDDIEQQLKRYKKEKDFSKTLFGLYPVGPGKTYNYQVIHFQTGDVITRLPIDAEGKINDTGDLPLEQYYAPDYKNFPVLQHHSHPYYSIYNTFQKFKKQTINTPRLTAVFIRLHNIQALWTEIEVLSRVSANRTDASSTVPSTSDTGPSARTRSRSNVSSSHPSGTSRGASSANSGASSANSGRGKRGGRSQPGDKYELPISPPLTGRSQPEDKYELPISPPLTQCLEFQSPLPTGGFDDIIACGYYDEVDKFVESDGCDESDGFDEVGEVGEVDGDKDQKHIRIWLAGVEAAKTVAVELDGAKGNIARSLPDVKALYRTSLPLTQVL